MQEYDSTPRKLAMLRDAFARDPSTFRAPDLLRSHLALKAFMTSHRDDPVVREIVEACGLDLEEDEKTPVSVWLKTDPPALPVPPAVVATYAARELGYVKSIAHFAALWEHHASVRPRSQQDWDWFWYSATYNPALFSHLVALDGDGAFMADALYPGFDVRGALDRLGGRSMVYQYEATLQTMLRFAPEYILRDAVKQAQTKVLGLMHVGMYERLGAVLRDLP